jgi:hypothetical protein
LLKHILRYAELQSLSKLEFSEALATRLERLLRFEKPSISSGFNAALRDHTSLLETVQQLSTLNLPPKLQTFIQNLVIFQEISAQDSHNHREPQGSCTQSEALSQGFFHERKYLLFTDIHRQETEDDPTLLSKILHQYHSITEFLIETPENAISGIDATLVREFKNTYGDSALLCRYRPCPRASIGFSRVRDRDRHESSHTRKFKCEDASCEFHDSGFSTKSALQKHTQMYHRKIDEILLPIRRRQSATSLRERFLDPSDSPSRSDLHKRKLEQLDRQKPWPKQQLGTSSRSPQQGFAASEFRVHNEGAAYLANFATYQNIRSADATIRSKEPQDFCSMRRKSS